VDMKTFNIYCAWISTSLFKEIVEDLEVTMNHYGEPLNHKNVETKSRFIAPVSAFISPVLFYSYFY
jgi:hypothetical protein